MDKRNIFLRGTKVNLVSLTEEDIQETDWYGWFNDEETSFHLQKHYYPNTLKNQLAFLNTTTNNKSVILLGICTTNESPELIGVISLQGINYINRNAELSMVIGSKKHRGLVYAEESMTLVIDHAFFSLNLEKIYLGYLESLIPWGYFLQKRFNFVKEGQLEKHVYKNGKYQSVELLALFRENFKTKKKK